MQGLMTAVVLIQILSCNSSKKNSFGSFERIDPAFDKIISADAYTEIIADSLDWAEGPLWLDKQQALLFTDIPQNTIYKWTAATGKQIYLRPAGYTSTIPRGGETGANGLALNARGQLLLCQHGDRRIALMDAPIDAPAPKFLTVADNFQGKKFDSPNDLVLDDSNNIYFTDPPYGLEKNADDKNKEAAHQGVYRVRKDGTVQLLIDSLTRPNGLAFMPGKKTLIIANSDAEKKYWYAFDLDDNDSLVNPRIFYDANEAGKKDKGSPDGLKIDKNGNVFATGPGGVWIFDKNAKLLGKIRFPEFVSNCAFADDEKTLYVTADMYVVKVSLR
jgi:gluconolactonase